MPFVFAIIGLGFIIVAIRGTHKEAFGLLQSEFSGPNNFVTWALALFVLGMLGYVPVIRPVTRALLLLVLFVIVLKQGSGLFDSFRRQIASPTAPTPAGNVSIDSLTVENGPTMTREQYEQTPAGKQGFTLPQLQQPADIFKRFLFGQ